MARRHVLRAPLYLCARLSEVRAVLFFKFQEIPTLHPSISTASPTVLPSVEPSNTPSALPTSPWTGVPSHAPTRIFTLPPSSVPPTLSPTHEPSRFPTLAPTHAPVAPRTEDTDNVTSVKTSVEHIGMPGSSSSAVVERIDVVHNITHTTTVDERSHGNEVDSSSSAHSEIEARAVVHSLPPARPDTEVPWWAKDMGAHIPPAQPITPKG